jgi:transcription elongation factor GreA
MQVPTRRADKIPKSRPEAIITLEKYNELKKRLERLIKVSRPTTAADVKHMASMGDFSENAGYQMAKAKLRGINQRILDIEDILKRSEIINPSANKDEVQIGHIVTVYVNGKNKVYRILGSNETNPSLGIISHNSPLGKALLNHRVGDIIKINLNDKLVEYEIIEIA